jgi:hypothetical protein
MTPHRHNQVRCFRRKIAVRKKPKNGNGAAARKPGVSNLYEDDEVLRVLSVEAGLVENKVELARSGLALLNALLERVNDHYDVPHVATVIRFMFSVLGEAQDLSDNLANGLKQMAEPEAEEPRRNRRNRRDEQREERLAIRRRELEQAA